jgi:TonB family protein
MELRSLVLLCALIVMNSGPISAQGGKRQGSALDDLALVTSSSVIFEAAHSAQESTGPEWQKHTGRGEEFSIRMPGTPSLYTSNISLVDRTERMYSSYSKGSVYLVLSYNNSSIRAAEESFKLHHLSRGKMSFDRETIVNGYRGKQYKVSFKGAGGFVQFYSTSDHSYAVAIVQKVIDPPLVDYFFSTLELRPNKAPSTVRTNMNLPSQEVSDLPAEPLDLTKPLLRSAEFDEKAVIVSKPEFSKEHQARWIGVRGKVVLRVILSSSGEVKNIRVVSSLPNGLTELAVEAARSLRFIPAVKNGRFVSMWLQAEYHFH